MYIDKRPFIIPVLSAWTPTEVVVADDQHWHWQKIKTAVTTERDGDMTWTLWSGEFRLPYRTTERWRWLRSFAMHFCITTCIYTVILSSVIRGLCLIAAACLLACSMRRALHYLYHEMNCVFTYTYHELKRWWPFRSAVRLFASFTNDGDEEDDEDGRTTTVFCSFEESSFLVVVVVCWCQPASQLTS